MNGVSESSFSWVPFKWNIYETEKKNEKKSQKNNTCDSIVSDDSDAGWTCWLCPDSQGQIGK